MVYFAFELCSIFQSHNCVFFSTHILNVATEKLVLTITMCAFSPLVAGLHWTSISLFIFAFYPSSSLRSRGSCASKCACSPGCILTVQNNCGFTPILQRLKVSKYQHHIILRISNKTIKTSTASTPFCNTSVSSAFIELYRERQ